MSKEYIIVDSNNNWLSTDRTKKEALQSFKEHKDRLEEEQDDTALFLYEAKEIKRFQFN